MTNIKRLIDLSEMTKRVLSYCDYGGYGRMIFLGLAGCLSTFLAPFAAAAQPASSTATQGQPGPSALPPKPPIPSADALKQWRAAMARVRPTKSGCFKSSYPSTRWQEVPCSTATLPPLMPVNGRRPAIVGGSGGTGLSALATGQISSATGSFDPSTNVTGETSNSYDGQCSLVASNVPDSFSLQLNTNTFSTSASDFAGWQCGINVGDPCEGWQQFVYYTSPGAAGSLSAVVIQSWLLNPTSACPAGWTSTTAGGTLQCSRTVSNPVAPPVTTADLPSVALTGTAVQGSYNSALLAVGTTMYMTSISDSVLDLAGNWIEAEFNIFGPGCFSEATFATGSTISVKTSVSDGSSNPPTCDLVTFTGETNNLNLQPGSLASGGASPAISFIESGDPAGTPACAIASSHGDTHLTTFDGLLYDFQASGDFTLIKARSDFTVQARQVSAKPAWPNASFNTAVGMQMGASRVALCVHPTRLMINGKSAELEDGKSLLLPSGVYIRRKSNEYFMARQNGDSVTAMVHSNLVDSWIDVSIGLGRWPTQAHGLLANVGRNVRQIETRGGTVLTIPFSFDDLYHSYANSWRVPLKESLLSICGEEIEIGIPKRPFYVSDLDPKVYQRTRAVCTEAGVKAGPLLDACTLDVAVIGETAAKVFVGAPAPVAVGKVTSADDSEPGFMQWLYQWLY